jgi:hypothetical protein
MIAHTLAQARPCDQPAILAARRTKSTEKHCAFAVMPHIGKQ